MTEYKAVPEDEQVIVYQEKIPQGIICMWSGVEDSIPNGWKLCDGTTYGIIKTPDLRSRFIVGADSENKPNTRGDSTTSIDLKAKETSSAGNHHHWIEDGGEMGEHGVLNKKMNYQGEHTHTINGTLSYSTEIKPKWYALCFIMRV